MRRLSLVQRKARPAVDASVVSEPRLVSLPLESPAELLQARMIRVARHFLPTCHQ
ncbi:hypothetical protein OKW35_002341 [Paraburkholderia sp. MM5477-R1]